MKQHKKYIASVLGTIISVVVLIFVLKKIDMDLFLATLKNTRIILLVLMCVLGILAILFRGIRSQLMLAPFKKIPLRRTSAFVAIGCMANNIFPARLGDLSRAYFTGKKEGISKATVFGSIAIEHIFDGLCILGIFSLTAILANFNSEHAGLLKKIGFSGAFIFIIALISLLLVRFNRAFLEKILNKFLKIIRNEGVKSKTSILFHSLSNSALFIRFDRTMLIFIFWTIIIWFCEGIIFFVALAALNLQLNWLLAFFVLGFTGLGFAVPSAPGFVGVFQGLIYIAFSFFGLDSNTALAYSVINHMVMLAPISLLGLLSFWLISEHKIQVEPYLNYEKLNKNKTE